MFGVHFIPVGSILRGVGKQGIGSGASFGSLVPAGLQESRQSCGAGNSTEGFGCSLLLLGCFQAELVSQVPEECWLLSTCQKILL